MGEIIMSNKTFIFLATCFIGAQSWAGSVTVPNTFVDGNTASAGEVNANFDAVKSAVDDNDKRITSNADDININASNITANTNAISLLGGASVFVDGVRRGLLLSYPAYDSLHFSILLASNYITRIKYDGTGISNHAVSADLSNPNYIGTLFTSSDCTGQSYAAVENGTFRILDPMVEFGQGLIFATSGNDPVPYRYIPSGSTTSTLTMNSRYHEDVSGCQTLLMNPVMTAMPTYPNDSNITGVTGVEFVGAITIGH